VTAASFLREAVLRVRLLLAVARPPLVLLLGLYAALGVAAAGRPQDVGAVARALVVVVGYVAFSVAVNDLADVAVDRVNLPGDASRALATGAASVLEMRLLAAVGAVVSGLGAALLGWTCLEVTSAALIVAAAYSLPPLRLSRRGIVAPLALPLGFVVVPFLAGVLAVRPEVRGGDLALVAGLYLGFIGRIVLKDFRDVRGDALLGKRTFLVRRGRAWTCGLSAALWVVGSGALLAVRQIDVALVSAYGVLVVVALVLLRELARSTSPRTDEALVAAIAMVGRGLILTLLVHYGTLQLGTIAWQAALAQGLVTVTVLLWAKDLVRRGLPSRLFAADPAGALSRLSRAQP
jgi:4-hydroxybenzoate polyprenyltransferase